MRVTDGGYRDIENLLRGNFYIAAGAIKFALINANMKFYYEQGSQNGNGSSIATENIAYNGITGNALVTRTQNEFDKDVFSVHLPAYSWINHPSEIQPIVN
jgi:hypothetical protein